MDSGCSRRMQADTMKTQRKIKEFQEKAENLAERSHDKKRREVLDEINSFLSDQLLPEWLSSLEKVGRGDVVAIKNLH